MIGAKGIFHKAFCFNINPKMKKYIISISLFIFSMTGLFGQQHSELLNLTNKATSWISSGALAMDFAMSVKEKNSLNSLVVKGKVILYDPRFHLITREMEVWFDGKNQWAYLPANKEVSLTQPYPEEIASVNPVLILTELEKNSRLQASKEKAVSGKWVQMIPKDKKANYMSVDLEVEPNSGKIFTIVLLERNGRISRVSLKNHRFPTPAEARFSFDEKEHPGVLINDLR